MHIHEPSLNHTEDLVKLLESISAISKHVNVEEVAREAARQIALLLEVDYCGIAHWDRENNRGIPFVYYTTDPDFVDRLRLQPYEFYKYPFSLQVLEEARPAQVRVDDPVADPAERAYLARVQSQCMLLLPLFADEENIGLVEAHDVHCARVFTKEQIARALVLTNHAGTAIERSRLLKEAQMRASELEGLRQASLSLTSSLDLETVLNAILESALHLNENAMDAHVYLYDGESLTFAAALWANGSRDTPWKNVRKNGLTNTVAHAGQMLVVTDISQHPLFKNTTENWSGSIIGIPLKIGERVVGVMNVAYSHPRTFNQAELRLLGLLADQAAITIENARLHNLVTKQALTDPLTELPNRRAFDLRLQGEIRRSSRYKHVFSLFIIDLNDFKHVNDTFGHLVGDKVLQRLGTFMGKNARDTDFLARIGGDEFALLLPETGKNHAQTVAEKFEQALDQKVIYQVEGQDIRVRATVGIASFPADAESAEDLLNAADRALYRRKEIS